MWGEWGWAGPWRRGLEAVTLKLCEPGGEGQAQRAGCPPREKGSTGSCGFPCSALFFRGVPLGQLSGLSQVDPQENRTKGST